MQLLAILVNDLTAVSHDLDVILDDYHLAESPEVAAGLQYLLDHLPPNVRVVVSTRVDPALPLARMRVRNELQEVRAADLRFTLEEVTRSRRRDQSPARGVRARSRTPGAVRARSEDRSPR